MSKQTPKSMDLIDHIHSEIIYHEEKLRYWKKELQEVNAEMEASDV